jgi:hypothetical protein
MRLWSCPVAGACCEIVAPLDTCMAAPKSRLSAKLAVRRRLISRLMGEYNLRAQTLCVIAFLPNDHA